MAYSIGSPLNLMSLVPDFRLEGLKEAQTFATTQQGIAQGIDNQRAIRQDARQQEFYKAINETPPEQIASLRRKFPEFTQAIQQELGIQSAEHSAFVNSALNKISIAASTGNPNEIANALNSNSAALSSLGVSKDDAWQLYQQDPARFNSLLNASRLATLPMDKQFDVQHQRDQLNETIRNNDMTNARAIRGQDLSYKAQMARLNHDKYVFKQSQAALERAGQLQDMDVLSLNSQIAATGIDPLTGKAATSARMSQAKRWLDGNNNYNNALISGERGIEKIDSLLGKKELEGIGRFEGRNIDGFTSAEGLANRNAIEELKSGAFVQNVQTMRGMGSLSNAEGQKLENLIAKLDITQPEEVVRKQLSEIRSQYSVFQKVAAREAESMGYSSSGYDTYVSERKSGSDSNKSGFSSLWGD
ncbi:TPA: phage DNA ejection protein [Escherichia coli]|uniref:phage DNA ejection protein n=1 Tax=Escherichia coli TaxID=562 RepID=UPI0010ABB6AB|nr:phage DNA ejection protein [Escherichia coli]TJG59617.1 DNA injection protein [Escherichia coli]HAM2737498.1 DNA injection protein [Escherichia coli]HAM2846303.1 DNA injection protein [Escherichia coli]HAM2957563.1 DNA injection protein [Escherichia coli]HAM3019190.1 DNA injection protein [Escherichia coli]